jgi:hypothetical protein
MIGVPGDAVDGHDGAGSVILLDPEDAVNNSTIGLISQVSQNSPGVPGASERSDHFGASIASGGASGNQASRYLIGAPDEDIGSIKDAGNVTAFTMNASHQLSAPFVVSQDMSNVPGEAAARNQFGASVAIQPLGGPRWAFGIPGADQSRGQVLLVDIIDAGFTPDWQNATALGPPRMPGVETAGGRYGAAIVAITGVRENVIAASSPSRGHGIVVVSSRMVSGQPLPNRRWEPGVGGVPDVGRGFGSAIAGLQTR